MNFLIIRGLLLDMNFHNFLKLKFELQASITETIVDCVYFLISTASDFHNFTTKIQY